MKESGFFSEYNEDVELILREYIKRAKAGEELALIAAVMNMRTAVSFFIIETDDEELRSKLEGRYKVLETPDFISG